MRLIRRITEWDDARGFGFVQPDQGGDRAFLHIKAFDRRGGRPFEGALVSHEVGVDERQRHHRDRQPEPQPGQHLQRERPILHA